MIFSQRVRELRNEFDMSQPELAELLGVSASTIKKIELGQRQTSFENLIKLSEIFHCSIDYLLGVEKEEHQNQSETVLVPIITGYENGEFIYSASDEWMNVPSVLIKGRKVIGYPVHDDSVVEAGIREDDIAFISLQGTTDYNDITLIETPTGIMLRRIKRHEKNYLIQPQNSSMDSDIIGIDEIKILGKVIAVFRRIT